MKFVKFDHWEKKVWSREDLRGKHREHCLCYSCKNFHPNKWDRDNNCPIARAVYALCVEFNLVTPVYECPAFDQKDESCES
jgi:hypothetical protein